MMSVSGKETEPTSSAIMNDENVVTTVATANDIETPAVGASTTPAVTTTMPDLHRLSTENEVVLEEKDTVAIETLSSTMQQQQPQPQQQRSVPLFLRWSRLQKTVQVQEANAGLMRRSIADPSSKRSRGSSVTHNGPIIKPILNQVSGFAAPGQVLALIGPSGSGKTTLLDALSGRTGLDSGVISVNGNPIVGGGSGAEGGGNGSDPQNSTRMKRFVSKVAYVKQEDIFFVHLTVRDQLAYTAFLRLPQAWTRVSKLQEVDRIIQLLRLTHVQHSPIQCLSGGEKKRVNIGTELLTNPSCLILDEPTSGLDSTNAVALVRMLQNLAVQQQKTVLMSIHQPSSGMFLSFDSLLLLADGYVVYFGTPRQSIAYLKGEDGRFSSNLACPEGYNAADHWMDLLVTSDGALEEEDEDLAAAAASSPLLVATTTNGENINGSGAGGGSSMMRHCKSGTAPASTATTTATVRIHPSTNIVQRQSTRQQLIDAWDDEAVAEQVDCAVREQSTTTASNAMDFSSHEHTKQNEGGGSSSSLSNMVTKKYNTSWWVQYRVLVHRAMKNSRSAIFTPLNMIKSALLGIVAGLLWFQLEYTEKAVHDHTSYVFFTMTYWVFDSMFTSLLAFPSERQVILKERASSAYHLSAYFLAKTTSEAPTRLTLPLIYMTISFWLAGISNRFSVFLLSTMISLLSVLAGEAIGLLIGASIDRMDRAMTSVTVVALTMMLLGGFYVENVPVFVAWLKFLSPFKYAFDASRQIIFDRNVPCDGSGQLQDLCIDATTESVSPEELLDFLGVQGSIGFNVVMLLVLGFVPRYFAFLALKLRKRGERG